MLPFPCISKSPFFLRLMPSGNSPGFTAILIVTALFCLFSTNFCKAEKIHDAVVNGDFNKVKYYSQNLKSIDVKDSYGRTPLHYAAQNGDIKIAEWLISRKVDVNAQDGDGYSPLHLAAANGYYELIALLISNGANVSMKDDNGQTPLSWAVTLGQEYSTIAIRTNDSLTVEKILIGNGKNTRNIDIYKKTIAILMANGATFKEYNQVNNTPIYKVFGSADNKDLLEFILDNYYKGEINGEEGKRLLRYAVENYKEESAKILISKGAMPDIMTVVFPLKDKNPGFAVYLFFSNKTYVAGLCFIVLFAIAFVVFIKKSWKTKKAQL
jgi:hypothetical protein